MWTFISIQQPPDVWTSFNHDKNDTNQRCKRKSSSKQGDILCTATTACHYWMQNTEATTAYPKLNDHFQIVSKLFIVFQGKVFKFLVQQYFNGLCQSHSGNFKAQRTSIMYRWAVKHACSLYYKAGSSNKDSNDCHCHDKLLILHN